MANAASSSSAFMMSAMASLGLSKQSSSPLPNDLQSVLMSLSRRVEDAKGSVYSAVSSRCEEFTCTFNGFLGLRTDLQSLDHDLTELIERIDGDGDDDDDGGEHIDGVRKEMQMLAGEKSKLLNQLDHVMASVDVLTTLCSLQDALDDHQVSMDSNDFVAASRRLVDMAAGLKALRVLEENGCDARVFAIIRSAERKARADTKARLEEVWMKCIQWKPSLNPETAERKSNGQRTSVVQRHELHIQYTCTAENGGRSGAPVSLSCAVHAMNRLDMLNAKLSSFCRSALKYIFVPLVDDISLTPDTKVSEVTAIFQLVRENANPDVKIALEVPALLYTKLRKVLDFLETNVFMRSTGSANVDAEAKKTLRVLMGCLGERLWPELCSLLIKGALAPAIPSCIVDFPKFEAVVAATAEFEATLTTSGLLPSGNDEDESFALLDYARNVNVHFANKRREQLLARAREISISEDYNTVAVDEGAVSAELAALASRKSAVGNSLPVDLDVTASTESHEFLHTGIFSFPACHISASTKTFVEFLYTTLNEAIEAALGYNGGSDVAIHHSVILFHSVRDMLELWRAVVPIAHGERFLSLPQAAMVHHNDCFYLAHHLLTLGHQYRRGLLAPLDETATFVDMVPEFRRMGEATYLAQLDSQRNILMGFLDGACSFCDTHEEKRFAVVDRAVKQTMLQLGRLAKVWAPGILPPAIRVSALGTLSGYVLCRIVDEILALSDISVDETRQLQLIMDTVIERLPSIFSLRNGTSNVISECCGYKRFTQLHALLDFGLSDITAWFLAPPSQGGRQPLEFSAIELEKLIRALFADNQLRRLQLEKIK